MIQQIFFPALNQVEVREAPSPPAPGNDDVLLEPAYVGICGTDLHILHGKLWIKPPVVIGHEVAAVVRKVGANVQQFSAGDRVVLNPNVPCFECEPCRQGRFNICEKKACIGTSLPGGAQTELVVHQRQLHKIPASLPLHDAALAEPLAVGVHAVRRASDLGDVLIIGGGTIGLCVLVAAKAAGARRVTVVEPVKSKRALALHLGATAALALDEPIPEGRFTTCFDIVCSQKSLNAAEKSSAIGGMVVMVGTAEGRPDFDLIRLQRYEIVFSGCSAFLDADIKEAINLLTSGAIDTESFITGRVPLADAPRGYADAAKPDNVKTIIQIQ